MGYNFESLLIKNLVIMKKKNVNFKLGLKKYQISNLQSVSGGIDVTFVSPCPTPSEHGPCGSGTTPSITEISVVASCAIGCTRTTIELSYCNNGIPNPCLSVQICA
jgi:hypothetical protein